MSDSTPHGPEKSSRSEGAGRADPGTQIAVLCLTLVVLQVVLCLWFFRFTADDAYIIARYARNLAVGHGLVFNPGEPVGAITSPLAAMVEAGLQQLFGVILLPYKLLCMLLVLLVGFRLWRGCRDRPERAAIVAALLFSSPFVALWTIGGMETPLLLFLLTLATIRYLERGDSNSTASRQVAFSVLLGLAFLARHDAALFGAALALAWVAEAPRAAARLLLPGALLATSWLVFAWTTYHDPLPTSFYIKTPGLFSHEVKQNVKYLAQFLGLSGFGLATLWVAFVGGGDQQRFAARCRSAWSDQPGLYLGLVLMVAYALLAASKHMMFSYRLLVPYLPAMSLALVELLPEDKADRSRDAAGTQLAAADGPRSLLPIVFTAIVAAHLILAWQIDRVSLNPGWVGEYRQLSRREYVEGFAAACRQAADDILADWRDNIGAGHRPPRLATFAAGITPYYLPEAYVLETLVSYRHGQRLDLGAMAARADYTMVLVPEHGPIAEQLPSDLCEQLRRVATYEFEFDGRANVLYVFFNPAPLPHGLSTYVDGVER